MLKKISEYRRHSVAKWINYTEGIEGTARELFPKAPTFLKKELGSHRTLAKYLSVLGQISFKPTSGHQASIFHLHANAAVKTEVKKATQTDHYRERIRILARFFVGKENEWWTTRNVFESLTTKEKAAVGGIPRVGLCMKYLGFQTKPGFQILPNKKWDSWLAESGKKN